MNAAKWHKKSTEAGKAGWNKMIHLELCKRLKFYSMDKNYMHKLSLWKPLVGVGVGCILPLCRKAVGVFYSPSWLGTPAKKTKNKNGSITPGQKNSSKKIRNLWILADYNVKIKQSEKLNKHLNEPKKLGDIKVTVILIVNGTLGIVPKNLENTGSIETIQTTLKITGGVFAV